MMTLTPASILTAALLAAAPTAPGEKVGLWERFERAFTNEARYTDPYRDVGLDVTYIAPDGRRVPFWGFFDGGATWKIRFMPDQLGIWRYEARFSDGAPAGGGRFACVPSTVPGQFAVHGPNPIWFGWKAARGQAATATAKDAGARPVLIRSLHVGDRFFAENFPDGARRAFLEWAARQGYNTLSIASHYLNRDDEGRGRGWRTPRLWPLDAAEYRKAEALLDELARRRFVVFPFAGFFGRRAEYPRDPTAQTAYIRYALARFGPYWNTTLNVAGPEPMLESKPYMTAEEIDRLGREIARLDPFGHPLSVHNPTGDDHFRDAPWTTFGTLQGPKTIDRARAWANLLQNHHPAKPLYAQETLWSRNEPQMKALGGRDFTDDDIRKNAYVINFAAASLNFGDMSGNSSSGFSGTLELAARNQSRHDVVKAVWDFVESIPFATMKPCPALVDGAACLGAAGREHYVYLDGPRPVRVNVPAGQAFDGQWIDARDPRARRRAGKVRAGVELQPPPAGDDWILRLVP
jgi:hypothetical protein